MPIELHESQIPSLISWFNNFIGFAELKKRIDRVEMKLTEVGFDAAALNQRYAFHKRYLQLARRNRLQIPIKTRDPQNYRIISSIAALQLASLGMSEKALSKLRSRVRDALSPDRDWREFEHELRVLVHYLGAGCTVEIMDDNDNRFDFLVSRGNTCFEVECKTFNETLGYPISIDQSFVFFKAFKKALNQNRNFSQSGVFNITTFKRYNWKEHEISEFIDDFIRNAPHQAEYENVLVQFERNDRWAELSRLKKREQILGEMHTLFEQSNPHTMFAVRPNYSVMVCIKCNEPPRIVAGILERIKASSEQFSKTRPAVIWAHFLGISDRDFNEVIKGARKGEPTPFDVFGQYAFKSEQRRHICRLRLSVDSEELRPLHASPIILPRHPRGFSTGGPAYDLVSARSKFDVRSTNI